MQNSDDVPEAFKGLLENLGKTHPSNVDVVSGFLRKAQEGDDISSEEPNTALAGYLFAVLAQRASQLHVVSAPLVGGLDDPPQLDIMSLAEGIGQSVMTSLFHRDDLPYTYMPIPGTEDDEGEPHQLQVCEIMDMAVMHGITTFLLDENQNPTGFDEKHPIMALSELIHHIAHEVSHISMGILIQHLRSNGMLTNGQEE